MLMCFSAGGPLGGGGAPCTSENVLDIVQLLYVLIYLHIRSKLVEHLNLCIKAPLIHFLDFEMEL